MMKSFDIRKNAAAKRIQELPQQTAKQEEGLLCGSAGNFLSVTSATSTSG